MWTFRQCEAIIPLANKERHISLENLDMDTILEWKGRYLRMYKNNLCKSFADQNHGQFKHVIRLPDAFRQENPVAFFSRKLCTEFGRPKVFF